MLALIRLTNAAGKEGCRALREGAGSMGKEILRFAQDDSTDFGRETASSAVGAK